MNEARVGTAVIIKNQIRQTDVHNRVLMGVRKGSHCPGTWALPGGHLEYGETLLGCCVREIKEETNLDIDVIERLCFTENLPEEVDGSSHYITLYFIATVDDETILKNMEPDKKESWEWIDLEDLPSPLFLKLGDVLNREDVREW